jgi:predicted Zn-dependent peptidase
MLLTPPEEAVLANGLRVVVEKILHCTTVSFSLTIAQGSRNETPQQGGITHFCEHLLFKGTATRHWQDIAREFNLAGGNFNAVTSTDYLRVYATIIRPDLRPMLELVADMVLGSTFPSAEVERERNVILEEIAMYEDIPEDLCNENLMQALFLPHPLGRPIIGTRELVEGFQQAELLAYWQAMLVPERMILTACGNVELGEVVAMAEELFGHRQRGSATPLAGNDAPGIASVQTSVERKLEQVNFAIGLPAIKRTDDSRFDWLVYDTILGGGMGSRLFDEVREKRGLAYGIGSSLNLLREAGYLCISGSTRPETATTALQVCLEELGKLAQDGPSSQELEIALRQLERGHLLSVDGLGARSVLCAERPLYGLPFMTSEQLLSRLRAVDGAAVQSVAQKVVASMPGSLSIVGPIKKAKGLRKMLESLPASA